MRSKTTAIAATLVAVLGLWGCSGKGKEQAQPRQMIVPVAVAVAETRDVPIQIAAIGTVEPYNTVQVKSQVTGELSSVSFAEGQDVRKGQLLFRIDRRPLEAELRRLEATLAKDTATSANDRVQAERYTALFKEGVVSKQMADQMRTAANASDAVLKADEAAIENARVQLQYTTIHSPIDGRTGDLAVEPGNLVKANDVVLVTINQVNPIYVTFTVPEQYLPEIKRYSATGKLRVEAQIQNEVQPVVGLLTFIDNAVDRQTGTIKLKATFDNADRRLWPGQFVNTRLTLTTQPNAVTVPTQAVQTGQQGPYVFVINMQDKTAQSRPVKVGAAVRGLTVIQEGVAVGETVVTDGHLRLVPNAKVELKNAPGQPAQNAPGGSQPTQVANQGSR